MQQLQRLLLLFLSAQLAAADIFLYGARHEVPHYAYGYVGLDWPEEYATCMGSRQSPIQIPAHTRKYLRLKQCVLPDARAHTSKSHIYDEHLLPWLQRS